MPTPFYHLHLAQGLLAPAGRLPDALRNWLDQYRPAFLLGHTAPDVQTISGQTRLTTHFFRLPIQPGDVPPWLALAQAHPRLFDAAQVDPEALAFIAGYACHLQADWEWVQTIYWPHFSEAATWEDPLTRLLWHNVLRAALDLQLVPDLHRDIPGWLMAADPLDWLPFTGDDHLRTWRDWLAGQLQPGAQIHTIEVFAARQGLSAGEFARLLQDSPRLHSHVYAHVSPQTLSEFHDHVINLHNRLLCQMLLPEGEAVYENHR